MAKKKVQDLESILSRADKLWARGNYPLAEKEYLKAQKKGYQGDLSHKLAVCHREVARQKSKECLKKARTQLGKGNVQSALNLFEQAQTLEPQEWLEKKIAELREQVQAEHSFEDARQAEAEGAYQRAVELYEQASRGQEEAQDFVLRKALCLVKSGDYESAVQAFSQLEPVTKEGLYHQGFALIKTGRFQEGLQVWEKLNKALSHQQRQQFQEQLVSIVSGWAQTLTRSILDKSYQDDPASLHRALDYLEERLRGEDLEQDLGRCRRILIQDLWARQRYQYIGQLLEPPSGHLEGKQIRAFAKIFFRLAQSSGSHLDDLRIFWLTAVYDSRAISPFGAGSTIKQVRDRLILMAEELFKQAGNPDQGKGNFALVRWNSDKTLLGRLSGFFRQSGSSPSVLCTPEFALRFGRSQEMLEAIRRHKDFFENENEYLRTGGYYSEAGASQYLLDEEAYAEAIQSLPQPAGGQDEFVEYVAWKTDYHYFLHCLETGEDKAERYLKDVKQLWDIDSKYESIVLKYAYEALSASFETLQRYEKGLQNLLSHISSSLVSQCLSMIMSTLSIRRYNSGQISDAVLASRLKQALHIDPENEHALGNLRQTLIDLEVTKMNQTIDKGKLKKAGSIAAQSEYPEVRNSFIERAKEIIVDLDEMQENNPQLREVVLRELQISCRRVDPSHPILIDINKRFKSLQ